MNGHMLARKIQRQGYYWLIIRRDHFKHVQKCHVCQIYSDKIIQPSVPLRSMTSPWSFFTKWALDYFTKWVEWPHMRIWQSASGSVCPRNIICRYALPQTTIIENSKTLNNGVVDALCLQFKFSHHNSTPYRSKMNGTIEGANKTIKKIL